MIRLYLSFAETKTLRLSHLSRLLTHKTYNLT